MLLDKIKALAAQHQSENIAIRRHLHAHPELSYQEFETSKYVQAQLTSIGIPFTVIATTGVLGIIEGKNPTKRVIALRADMDALPIIEENKIDYKSTNEGVMHACGHDSHTAMLMATAKMLSAMQKELPGTIVFLFQPAEEGLPGTEEGGAPLMIKEGALDNPKVEAVFGIHISSQTPVGTLKYKSGAFMASSDWFTIKVNGKGSHGAMPWGSIDPIVISAEIIEALQHIVSRESDLTKAPLVISIGSLHSGVRANIIPETAEMLGTIRSLDATMRKETHEKMRRVVQHIAQSAGATATIEINTQTMINYNDPRLAKKSLSALNKAAGADNVMESRWTTAAEDFSFYGDKAPSFFFSLGGMQKGKNPTEVGGHHTPDFYLDESGFILGVKAFCNLVFDNAKP